MLPLPGNGQVAGHFTRVGTGIIAPGPPGTGIWRRPHAEKSTFSGVGASGVRPELCARDGGRVRAEMHVDVRAPAPAGRRVARIAQRFRAPSFRQERDLPRSPPRSSGIPLPSSPSKLLALAGLDMAANPTNGSWHHSVASEAERAGHEPHGVKLRDTRAGRPHLPAVQDPPQDRHCRKPHSCWRLPAVVHRPPHTVSLPGHAHFSDLQEAPSGRAFRSHAVLLTSSGAPQAFVCRTSLRSAGAVPLRTRRLSACHVAHPGN